MLFNQFHEFVSKLSKSDKFKINMFLHAARNPLVSTSDFITIEDKDDFQFGATGFQIGIASPVSLAPVNPKDYDTFEEYQAAGGTLTRYGTETTVGWFDVKRY